MTRLASVTHISPGRPPAVPAPRRRWRPLRLLMVTGLVLACTSATLHSVTPTRPVVLQVTGGGSATVTYRVGDRTYRPGLVLLPQRWTLPAGTPVVVVAQAAGAGPVTCRIGNAEPVTATGEYAVAVCRG